jgi:hypothetical protein
MGKANAIPDGSPSITPVHRDGRSNPIPECTTSTGPFDGENVGYNIHSIIFGAMFLTYE